MAELLAPHTLSQAGLCAYQTSLPTAQEPCGGLAPAKPHAQRLELPTGQLPLHLEFSLSSHPLMAFSHLLTPVYLPPFPAPFNLLLISPFLLRNI